MQRKKINELRIRRSEIDIASLVDMLADGIFNKGLVVETLLRATEMLGPFAVDRGKKIWYYSSGVWCPDGMDELTRRVLFCTGDKYRKEYVNQVVSLVQARKTQIVGLGPLKYLNLKNGMLNWSTQELVPHNPNFYSPIQLDISWNPEATCPEVDKWMASTFDSELHTLLWEIIGVCWYPGMGFQKMILLVGSGNNGKGTFLRLCSSALPDSATSAIDPKIIAGNRFASAELFGKTLNVCGDIDRFTFTATGEIKRMTGDDSLYAERKNGQPFNFTNEATMLFSGNKIPQSRDVAHGWFRRWLIVPMTRRIQGPPDLDIESRLRAELEGVLVKAVKGLAHAKSNRGFSEPEVSKKALENYEYSCNSSAFFINECIEFSADFRSPIGKNQLMDSYLEFCNERKLEIDSRSQFYSELEERGSDVIQDKWLTSSPGSRERGYTGVSFKERLM
jgi:putative DNA primase/helicase